MIYIKPLPPYETPKPRDICAVAHDIRAHWTKPNPAALPYLKAMSYLRNPNDKFGADDAKGIVLYFLSNATTFRGEHARRLKQELKNICGIK